MTHKDIATDIDKKDNTSASTGPVVFEIPGLVAVKKRVDQLILSASGWRGIFASNGDEESTRSDIRPVDRMIVACIAMAFSDWLDERLDERVPAKPIIVVGTDTRPTGPTIADEMIRAFSYLGISVRYTAVASAPEVMAYTKNDDGIHGFAYISASHNPVGHNGMKFGLGDGSVLEASASSVLKDRFLEMFDNDASYEAQVLRMSKIQSADIDVNPVYQSVPEIKRQALGSYSSFTDRVITGPVDEAIRNDVLQALREACSQKPFGIIGELNGSARSASIDKSYFDRLGVEATFINDTPGGIAHRIVPEGESLDPCRKILEKMHGENPGYVIGYVPDNDGDRGNLVYYDERCEQASIIHAQEVFALSCVSELAYLASIDPAPMDRMAIVINGPTSLRIEAIARLFGAQVFRAEVGEAHVVSKAEELRNEGYRVRILGEGSNGGTIIHPSTVRDPLSTIGAILKLLRLPALAGGLSPLQIWQELSGQERQLDGSISGVLETLPAFSTTGAYEDRAILKIDIPDHGAFKRSYERLFPGAFEAKRAELDKRFGFVSWRITNYEGLEEKQGAGNRDTSGAERGGLKVLFADQACEDRGFIWMRGSGTEPVFRVLADVEGNDATGEAWLLNWHKELIETAAREI